MSDRRLSEADDDALVARGRSGSEAALAELYRRHRGRVLGFVLRMTGDRDLAEEIFCATFAAFFEHLPRYRPRGRLAAYLLRIARNRLLDELKARGRLRPPPPEHDCDDANSPVAAGPPPDEALAEAEDAGRAAAALARLPEHLREVVVLRLYEGLDYATVAAVVGAGETTVRSRMRYALQTLRRMLGGPPGA